MTVAVGDELRLRIDKPAAGGAMIARHEGQVVLVSGAIPGETVIGRVGRLSKGVAHAQVVAIEDPSADRLDPFTDPLCGGCLYAHVAYPRQLEIKAAVIADAFARIGRLPLAAPVAVTASPAAGYRMRARLHVRGGRLGFFREGTHEICGARATRQLLPSTADVLDRIEAGLRAVGTATTQDVELAENIDASQRAIHFETSPPEALGVFASIAAFDGLTGLTVGQQVVGGGPYVVDELTVDGRRFSLRRHVQAFFQANRFLLTDLVAMVTSYVPAAAEVVDLYAGVGLFAIAAAQVRHAHVVAVEGDRVAASDLSANARETGGAVEPLCGAVEAVIPTRDRPVDLVIVDPPRTGMSRAALERMLALRAPAVVYVSCDVATLARDARRLVDAGYHVAGLEAFDLFPNTPHVETVVRFART